MLALMKQSQLRKPPLTRSRPRNEHTAVAAYARTLWVVSVFALGSWAAPAAQTTAPGTVIAQGTTAEHDGQHDFDFEFGNWKARVKRLVNPLSGSDKWVDYEGTSVVRKVWDGRANLGELEIDSPTGHIEGMSLRVYNPQSRQWSIYWANSKDGGLGTAMIGRFANGRGEFYDQELVDGRAVFVRFIFSDITPASFRLEQAFSADGGKTWEPNWIATFTRDPKPEPQ
jgi:hypothetical protein